MPFRATGRWAAAVLSGLLLGLSFPKFGTGEVAWVALVPLLVAVEGAGPWRAAGLAYATGVVSALILLYWTALVVVQFGGLSLPAGIGVMVLLCLAFSLFTAAFGAVVGRFERTLGRGTALLLAPFAWVSVELLRAHVLLSFPWCLLGYSQSTHPVVIQGARFAAVYGVSFLLAGTSSAIACAATERRPPRRLLALLGVSGLLVLVVADGARALARPPAESGRIRAGLVQGNVRQDEKWDPALAMGHVDRHVALTREAAGRGARLVVWPESSFPFYFDERPALAAELRALARDRGVFLLFGNDDAMGEPLRYFVGAKMLSPAGDLVLRYHKIRLVPFGEYVPLKDLLGRRKVVQQVSDFTPGTEAVLGLVEGHAVGVSICYEAIFPDLVRRFAGGGAELLVNITNDAWYGTTSAPYQHFSMAVFRAVENGTYLLRAANTGITALVDPRGRVLERLPLFEPDVLVVDAPFVPGGTFYSRHGDVFAWSCLGATGLFALWPGVLRRQGRPARADPPAPAG